MNSIANFLILVSTLALTFGCGPAVIDSDIQREYTKTARLLGVTPVYPPREDFQVGDLRLVSYGTSGKESYDTLDAISIWAGSQPSFVTRAEEYLRTRIVFQESTSTVETGKHDSQDDLIAGSFKTRGQVSIESLPIEGFPQVRADAGLSSATAVSRLFGALGLSTSRRTQVTLDFNDVRSYGVPLGGGLAEFVATYDADEFDIFDLTALRLEADRQRSLGRKVAEERCIVGTMITKVYLTRSINYTYSNAEIIAAALRRGTEEGVAAPSPVIVTVANASGAFSPPTDAEVAEIVAETNKAPTDAQGTGLSFVSWNALGITLNRRFRHPVVIAWEGVSFDPKLEDPNVKACPS